MASYLIKNATLVHPDDQRKEDILIRDEKIAARGKSLPADSETEVIDGSGHLVFPGIVDPHTHMGIPIKSGTSADTFATGSRSAIHGGVTTILDFTVLDKEQGLWDSILHRRQLAKESTCDYGLHVNITRYDPHVLKEIPEVIKSGISSFKVFTTYKEAGMMLSYDQIEKIAEIISRHNGILMVHAEDNDIIEAASGPLISGNETAPRFHGLSRPPEAEVTAIEHLGRISDRTGCKIYVVHLNTGPGLEVAASYQNLYVESCPHYLMLGDDVYERPDGRMFVASPPLRTTADTEALWRGLETGQLHTLGTDHCPFYLADKPESVPFQHIPNGMGGVETFFPVMLAQFLKRGYDLSLLTRLTSTRAAQIFGLYPQKGTLAPGTDADLVIVDPSVMQEDWVENLETDLDWNAYSEFPAIFPKHVFRRGDWLVRNGQLGELTKGQFLFSDFG